MMLRSESRMNGTTGAIGDAVLAKRIKGGVIRGREIPVSRVVWALGATLAVSIAVAESCKIMPEMPW